MPDEFDHHVPSGRVVSNGAEEHHDEEEISLIDLLLVVARYKRVILMTIGVFFVAGFLYALLAPDQYTSSAKVVREIQADASSLGNIGALSALRGFGLSLGAASTGLTPEAYPDITKGREVKLAVVRDTFYFPDIGESTTYVNYVERNRSFLGRLSKLPGYLIAAIKGKPTSTGIRRYDDTIIYITEEEARAIESVSNLVSTSVDLESGLMTIQTTTEDPNLSAELAASFVKHLVDRVREILTVKARQNLEFINERFEEAEGELRRAEAALARFTDRNTSMRSAVLAIERDRLQRQVTFKTQLYGDLQTQLTSAELELQRSEPVITILERPAPAIEPSGISGRVVLLIFILLGAAIGIAIAFIRWSIDQQMTDDDEREKMDLIRKELGPGNLIPRRFRRRKREKQAPEESAPHP